MVKRNNKKIFKRTSIIVVILILVAVIFLFNKSYAVDGEGAAKDVGSTLIEAAAFRRNRSGINTCCSIWCINFITYNSRIHDSAYCTCTWKQY